MGLWFSFSEKGFWKWQRAAFAAILAQFCALIACDTVENDQLQTVAKFVPPRLVDTTAYDSVVAYPQNVPFSGKFIFVYIGKPSQEIVLGGHFFDLEPFRDEYGEVDHRGWGAARLEIVVDTTQPITLRTFEFRNHGSPVKRIVMPVIPIFVWNPTEFTFTIGNSHFLRADLLGLNRKDHWQKILGPPRIFCGTGEYEVLLPPKHLAIAVIPAFQGKIPARLRFQLNDAISNEFIAGFDSLPQNLEP